MNLRELAEKDLATTLEDAENGFGSEFTLISPDSTEYELCGICGDVSYLLDTDGVPVSGRSIVVSYRLSSFVDDDGNYREVKLSDKGRWKCRIKDLSGKEWLLYVTDFKPDRTIGIGVLSLSLEYKK